MLQLIKNDQISEILEGISDQYELDPSNTSHCFLPLCCSPAHSPSPPALDAELRMQEEEKPGSFGEGGEAANHDFTSTADPQPESSPVSGLG